MLAVRRLALFLCFIVVLNLVPPNVLSAVEPPPERSSGVVNIDFEGFPGDDGVLGTEDDVPIPPCEILCLDLSTEFSALGLLFGPGALYQVPGGFFPDLPEDNHFLSGLPLNIYFDQDYYSVSIRSFSLWGSGLYAYNQEGQLLASDTLVHTNPGVESQLGTLSLTSEEPIYQVIVMADTCPPDPMKPPNCDQIVNLDDLQLGSKTSAIFSDGFESGDLTVWETP